MSRASNGRPPADAETVEMLNGIIYWSRDNWQTIYAFTPSTKRSRKVAAGVASDRVRFLAVSQSSAGPS